jgi:hypothetical protein
MGIARLLFCNINRSRFSFVDAEFIAIRVHDDCRPAARRHHRRLKRKPDVLTREMFDRLIEIVRFQHHVRTISGRLEERLVANTERVRTDLFQN